MEKLITILNYVLLIFMTVLGIELLVLIGKLVWRI